MCDTLLLLFFRHISVQERDDLSARARHIRRECRFAGTRCNALFLCPKAGFIEIIAVFDVRKWTFCAVWLRRTVHSPEECHNLPARTRCIR